jgi:glycerophosphoryl diester phosphodiesterase
MKKIATSLFGILTIACMIACNENISTPYKVDVQGHRGARAVYPENSIEGFIYALQQGVTTLEMDVVITKDLQVVLSHEPWMGFEICLDTTGNEISEATQMQYNIYQMNYTEVLQYDCGRKPHPRFPQQQKMKTTKPLLSAVIDTIEKLIAEKNLPKVYYNIETKCLYVGDNIFHPTPEIFSKLLLKVIREKQIAERVFIQSFDVRTLQYIHKNYAEIKTVLLIENENSPEENLKLLGYTPTVYSPYYKLVNGSLKQFCNKQNMQLIPWTVNEKKDIEQMLTYKVDGIISDNPAVVLQLLKEKNIKTIFEK